MDTSIIRLGDNPEKQTSTLRHLGMRIDSRRSDLWDVLKRRKTEKRGKRKALLH